MKETGYIFDLKFWLRTGWYFLISILIHIKHHFSFLPEWGLISFKTGMKHNLRVLEPCSISSGIHSTHHYFTQLALTWGTVLGQGKTGREYLASRSGSRWHIYIYNMLQHHFPISTIDVSFSKNRKKYFFHI